jgi:hypothetical protein
MNQNGNDNIKNEKFETFIVDKKLKKLECIIYTIFELTINKDQKYLNLFHHMNI